MLGLGESMVNERVADLQRMGRLRDLLSERLLNQKQTQDEIGADRDVDASLYTGGFFQPKISQRWSKQGKPLRRVAYHLSRVMSVTSSIERCYVRRLTCRLIKRPFRLG